jgi:hypothetical protein
MESVKTRLSSQAADFLDTDIKKVFLDMKSCSVPPVTTLRRSINIYVFF